MSTNSRPIHWPLKHDIFGVGVSATTYDEITAKVIAAARRGQGGLLTFAAVHCVMCGVQDRAHSRRLNAFDVVATDGQPVRWALNLLHGAGLHDRVYGPEQTRRVCKAAAEQGVPIYLYGSMPAVLTRLEQNLLKMFPNLKIAGMESPPFRPLTAAEDDAVVQRINASGAGILLIGLGAPKQERFAYDHRNKIKAVQLCVGAAFDFHAGMKKTAPAWMQKRGLEWLFRLGQEPGRLWKRYLTTNTQFALLFLQEAFICRRRRMEPVAA
jgi:exopolysaccharide biosynthesis WecB/TagA/CpsF family protein